MPRCLGVGVAGVEWMAEPHQLVAQLNVIVDFAVEDHADGVVFVPHRLRAACGVADRQPAMSKKDSLLFVDVEGLGVGPAVGLSARHRDQVIPIAAADESRYAAHQLSDVASMMARTLYAGRCCDSK